MIGCDLHDHSMVFCVAVGTESPVFRKFGTFDLPSVIEWIKDFATAHQTPRIVFAYEASGQGFGLYDELTAAGIETHVLAPTHLPYSSGQRKNKTDVKDAAMLLEVVRAHVLAGAKLPAVWIPDPQTRDDRETVRLRLSVAEQRTRVKNQIRNLLKRVKFDFPTWFTASGNWSKQSVQWLRDVADGTIGDLGKGLCLSLSCLVEMHEQLAAHLRTLDKSIAVLSKSDRYSRAFRKLRCMPGVGTLTAMVFLTELGDLARFSNRRQLSAYLGLVPTSFESGKRDDRKGSITRQGPSHLRHVLCQAAWAAVRCSEEWRMKFQRIQGGSSKRSKKAIVAIMRQLGVAMWHATRSNEMDAILDEIDQQKKNKKKGKKGKKIAA